MCLFLFHWCKADKMMCSSVCLSRVFLASVFSSKLEDKHERGEIFISVCKKSKELKRQILTVDCSDGHEDLSQ